MLRKGIFAAAVLVVANGGSAWARPNYGSDGPLGVALDSFFRRLDDTLGNIPAVIAYLKGLPALFDFRITALLIGIVLGGTAAPEPAVPQPARVRTATVAAAMRARSGRHLSRRAWSWPALTPRLSSADG